MFLSQTNFSLHYSDKINAYNRKIVLVIFSPTLFIVEPTYQAQYKKVGLGAINLSRVSEDAGTVVNPLVPWSVCGVFITKVLEVPTVAYLPFAFFCLLTPILTILFGVTGRTLTYTTSER